MERLRELRKNEKLSMKQLGELFGLAESTISLYERGKRQPDNDTLARIADYFGVSVDYLLGRETPTIPDYTPSEEERRLAEIIAGMTDEEVEELSRFVDYIISKRN